LSLNAYAGVVCGYCIDPADAYLFLQINNGNALSLPYAKGFGWGADLNLRFIFEKAFGSPKGQGYPADKKEIQNCNASILNTVKDKVQLDTASAIKALNPQLVKTACTPAFMEAFAQNAKDSSLVSLVKGIIG
jgi:ribose 5-phosphate isomerase B